MEDQGQKSTHSGLVVFTAGAFFFYSFIQMTLFSTEAMKQYFMQTLSLDTTAAFGNFAGAFLYGTVLFLIPIGVLLDKVPGMANGLSCFVLMGIGAIGQPLFALSLHNFDASGVEVMQSVRGIVTVSSSRNAVAQSHQRCAEKGVRSHLPERPFGCFAQMTPDPFFILAATFPKRKN